MSILIDRQETIKEFCKQDCDCDPKDCYVGTCYEVEIIESVPSAQPRKGKWIEHDDNWANVYYECSVCKEPFVLIDGTPTENLYNFCPNCGCRMEEGDSE